MKNITEIMRRGLRSSLRDWKGMEFPRMAFTSSSFLAFPVTKVKGRKSKRDAISLVPGDGELAPAAMDWKGMEFPKMVFIPPWKLEFYN